MERQKTKTRHDWNQWFLLAMTAAVLALTQGCSLSFNGEQGSQGEGGVVELNSASISGSADTSSNYDSYQEEAVEAVGFLLKAMAEELNDKDAGVQEVDNSETQTSMLSDEVNTAIGALFSEPQVEGDEDQASADTHFDVQNLLNSSKEAKIIQILYKPSEEFCDLFTGESTNDLCMKILANTFIRQVTKGPSKGEILMAYRIPSEDLKNIEEDFHGGLRNLQDTYGRVVEGDEEFESGISKTSSESTELVLFRWIYEIGKPLVSDMPIRDLLYILSHVTPKLDNPVFAKSLADTLDLVKGAWYGHLTFELESLAGASGSETIAIRMSLGRPEDNPKEMVRVGVYQERGHVELTGLRKDIIASYFFHGMFREAELNVQFSEVTLRFPYLFSGNLVPVMIKIPSIAGTLTANFETDEYVTDNLKFLGEDAALEVFLMNAQKLNLLTMKLPTSGPLHDPISMEISMDNWFYETEEQRQAYGDQHVMLTLLSKATFDFHYFVGLQNSMVIAPGSKIKIMEGVPFNLVNGMSKVTQNFTYLDKDFETIITGPAYFDQGKGLMPIPLCQYDATGTNYVNQVLENGLCVTAPEQGGEVGGDGFGPPPSCDAGFAPDAQGTCQALCIEPTIWDDQTQSCKPGNNTGGDNSVVVAEGRFTFAKTSQGKAVTLFPTLTADRKIPVGECFEVIFGATDLFVELNGEPESFHVQFEAGGEMLIDSGKHGLMKGHIRVCHDSPDQFIRDAFAKITKGKGVFRARPVSGYTTNRNGGGNARVANKKGVNLQFE